MKKGGPAHKCFLPTWSHWLHFLLVLQKCSVTYLRIPQWACNKSLSLKEEKKLERTEQSNGGKKKKKKVNISKNEEILQKFPCLPIQTKSQKPNFCLITCDFNCLIRKGIPGGTSNFKSNYQQCCDCWCLWAAICFCLVLRYCHVNQICGIIHRELWHLDQGKCMLEGTSSNPCLRQSHFIQLFFSEQKTGSVNWRDETFIKHKDS